MLSLQQDLPEFRTWNEETNGGHGRFCDSDGHGVDQWMVSSEWKKKATFPTDPADHCHGDDDDDKNASLGSEEHVHDVEGAPVAAYELSLRDLVKLPGIVNAMRENQTDGVEFSQQESRSWEERKKTNQATKGAWRRSRSVDNGAVLLKMFFPVSLGGRRRSGITRSASTTVPKPSTTKGDDGEHCKNSSSGELTRRKGGCSFFFQASRSKSRKNGGCNC
ncbi:hypothetical protein MUK42_18988 [Musa troglodytarum]|uniref:Uncharacterized protein n=1 Tax=Musa troglodytarum TaxID=320322 RepID=A0A9E7G188_9LILI|nr:hypothetical protein MUK42_18988 [Musa troglodytarum]